MVPTLGFLIGATGPNDCSRFEFASTMVGECCETRFRVRDRLFPYRELHKTIKDFLGWTTSKAFVVRFYFFGFAVLLYNMWLLVDLLVPLRLNVEHRYRPRVTAKRVLNLVSRRTRVGDHGS